MGTETHLVRDSLRLRYCSNAGLPPRSLVDVKTSHYFEDSHPSRRYFESDALNDSSVDKREKKELVPTPQKPKLTSLLPLQFKRGEYLF